MTTNLIDDPYAQQTLDAINAANSHPLPTPVEPKPSQVWNTLTAAPRGVLSGATQAAAFGFDTLKAYGDTVAGYTANTDPSLIADPQAQAKQWLAGQQARNDLTSGAAYSSSIGDNLYGFTSSLAPNPATSNVAEQTIYGLAKGLTKFVGLSVLSGNPYVGATLTGASEGEAASQELKEKGVDLGTRTAVGTAVGTGTAIGGVIPVAGSTLGRTATLALGAGPGSYIAQTAATKAILQSADYTKLADQYDPFDPVGLAVSTLVPAGFGAYHYRATAGARAAATVAPPVPDAAAARQLVQMGGAERQALPFNDPRLNAYASQVEQQNGLPAGLLNAVKNAGERSNSGQVSPAGARGVMQFTDPTWGQYGNGADRTDPVASIDAAGRYFSDLLQRYDGNVRAALTEYNGGVRQAQAVARGGEPTSPETRAYLQRIQQHLGDEGATEALTGMTPTPDQVDAARVLYNRQLLDEASLGGQNDLDAMAAHLTAFQRTVDQMSTGTRVDVGDLIQPDQMRQADALTAMIGRLDDAHADLLSQIGNAAEPGTVSQLRGQLADLTAAPPPTLDDVVASLQPPARSYQVTATRAAREQAEIQRQAPIELQSRLDAQQEQISRLRGVIATNRDAEIARAALPGVEAQRTALRGQRDALGTPPSRLTDRAAAVRQTFDDGPDVTPRPSDAPETRGAGTSDKWNAVFPGEPPVPEGMTRLFHGSASHGRYDGPAWFSTNREYAANYRPGAELQYVDYPTEKVNASLDPDGYGQTVQRGFTWNAELDSSETGIRRPIESPASNGRNNEEVAANSSNSVANAQPASDSGGGQTGESVAPHDYQSQFEAENADLPVGTAVDPETNETRIVTLGEQMAAARAEAEQSKALAPLMRVAAQCFLSNGD